MKKFSIVPPFPTYVQFCSNGDFLIPVRRGFVILHREYAEVPISRGFIVMVDLSDVDLAIFCWSAGGQDKNKPYAYRFAGNTSILMHRIILARKIGFPIPDGLVTDHINRNRLDNRRGNLQLATVHQNNQNKSVYK